MTAANTIVDLYYDGGDVHLVVSLWAVVVLGVVMAASTIGLRRYVRSRWRPVELDIALGGIGKMKVRRTDEVVRIAHQARIELVTRKAALPFDEDNDVVAEVYDSWYQLFAEIRRLAKSVPAEQLRDGGPAKDLIDVLVRALNDGLRPHLTRWQARYRTWHGSQPERSGRTPQELQRDFPEYEALLADLLDVNSQLVTFERELDRIVNGMRS